MVTINVPHVIAYTAVLIEFKEEITEPADELARKYMPNIHQLECDIDDLYLFSIGAEFENNLNEGIISDDLRDIFNTEGFPLSKDSTVTSVEDDKWMITDGKKIYFVKKEDGALNIYNFKDNGLIKIGYAIEENKDEARIEYNLVFKDEDDANWDTEYDEVRKLIYGRIEDIEGFSITVDLNGDTIKEIEFDGTWHNDWEYYDPKISFHNLPIDIVGDTRTFTDTSDFTVSNGHFDLYVGTWNHFFSNTADIQGIPCNEWVIVADYCLSDEKFVNKDRKELEDEYKG